MTLHRVVNGSFFLSSHFYTTHKKSQTTPLRLQQPNLKLFQSHKNIQTTYYSQIGNQTRKFLFQVEKIKLEINNQKTYLYHLSPAMFYFFERTLKYVSQKIFHFCTNLKKICQITILNLLKMKKMKIVIQHIILGIRPK